LSRRRATVDGRNSGSISTSATCSDNSSTTGSSK
uniref:Estrogen receptor alpha n=1 Tax=Anisakis simplex TaxID=6269 RepID=A0A0M3JPL6_ANISI